jgi:Uma2 family endonuclease
VNDGACSIFTPIIEIPAETPRSIVLEPPLSDGEFERLSGNTQVGIIERSSEGTILVSELSGGMTSSANAAIHMQFRNWSKRHRFGRALMHCGFFLSDGSCLRPDLAYLSDTQWDSIRRDQRDRFLRLMPEFVIELRSQSEKLCDIKRKMEAWRSNGVELGWLVDPYAREVHIYEAGASAPRIENGTRVTGSGPVAGFVLDLEEIWRCYE